MAIADNIITIETSLPEGECNIVNIELAKEVNYWKKHAIKYSENVEELKSQAPKRCILISRKKDKTKKEVSIESIFELLRSKVKKELPKVESYIPNAPKRKSIKRINELQPYLVRYGCYMNEVENFTLKNACLFGEWLDVAFELFRYEKYILKGVRLPATFDKWVEKNCDITKSSAHNYRKLAKLIRKAPKLINCRVGIRFFMDKHNLLLTYFKNNESPWVHKHSCECEKCKEYFKA